jgi:hypothetical protein
MDPDLDPANGRREMDTRRKRSGGSRENMATIG